uniref:Uncharacterized protein n=1 Tax=Anguilla anguilla TaxID=7936 RepID=A0A0E9R6H9_ANGAN
MKVMQARNWHPVFIAPAEAATGSLVVSLSYL